MYGLSYLLQFVTVGIIFFLAAIFMSNNHVDVADSLSVFFLVFFTCTTAGHQSNFMEDISIVKSSAKQIFSIF